MQLICFHGTPKKQFKEFSFEHMGTESGLDAGFGLYFSTDKVDALTYGETVYECRLELRKNVDNHKVTFTETQLKAIFDSCEDIGHSYYELYSPKIPTDNEKNKIIRDILNEFKSDTQIIASLLLNSFDGDFNELAEILSKYGFTHTQDLDTPDNKTIQHYIVYDLNAIKIQKIEKLHTM